jgi:hypothetical protein
MDVLQVMGVELMGDVIAILKHARVRMDSDLRAKKDHTTAAAAAAANRKAREEAAKAEAKAEAEAEAEAEALAAAEKAEAKALTDAHMALQAQESRKRKLNKGRSEVQLADPATVRSAIDDVTPKAVAAEEIPNKKQKGDVR